MPGMTLEVRRERTLLICKPDAVRRGLVGEILSRIERKGLSLDAIRVLTATSDQIRENYRANEDEPWFEEMIGYMTSGPIVPIAASGPNAIESGRQIVGSKNPWESDSGSVRGEYAADPIRTVIHGSRDPVEALREIDLWFPELLGVEKLAPPAGLVDLTRTLILVDRLTYGKTYAALRER